MKFLSNRHKLLLQILSDFDQVQSSSLHEQISKTKEAASLVTIKRDLDFLTEHNFCIREGKGRSTTYKLTTLGLLCTPYDLQTYLEIPPDERSPDTIFNFDLFKTWPQNVIPKTTKTALDLETKKYNEALKKITPTIQVKELERFIIELSWKSSAIEGNTYTLLDTERLIRENIPAKGNSADETQMILNHKVALDFIINNLDRSVSASFVEKVHELLTKKLNVNRGIRKTLVGITGTSYTPLNNQFQIKEALDSLYSCVKKIKHPLEKALVMLAGLSYIQPFEDGNKRTARLISNAILLQEHCAPLSYRSTEIESYRNAMVLFYEKNSIVAIADILVDQYIFSTKHYRVK